MRADKFLPKIRDMKPDIIAVTGDIFHYLAKDPHLSTEYNRIGLCMLCELAKIAPTYVSVGNHDNGGSGSAYLVGNFKIVRDSSIPESARKIIADTGCILLDNSCVLTEIRGKKILLGGQTSGISRLDRTPELSWLESFRTADGADAKILLCHHPEYVPKYETMKSCKADIILSGHAHGGQIGFFGRGVFAPCQGFFAKYVRGAHKIGKTTLIISRGMKNTVPIIPRFFNPCEIVKILL
jgi:predicted MPP superfamily phosphohydrolase